MFLASLADVVRSAGLPCIEVDGWRTRTRSSSLDGYQLGRPDHVMCHHTASNASSDGQADVNYIISAPTAPIANLYLDRKGQVWVIAAGPTNTNGKGSAPWTTVVPPDAMNVHAIGIEAANNGVGEPWPHVQQDAYVRLCAALCVAYRISTYHVRAHHEWASGRKIDPAGSSAFATGSASWDMGRFRASVERALAPVPPTPPTDEDEPMKLLLPDDGDPATFLQAGIDCTWVNSEEVRDSWAFLGAGAPVKVPRSTFSALVLNGPLPTYDAADGRAKTVAADFAAHRP